MVRQKKQASDREILERGFGRSTTPTYSSGTGMANKVGNAARSQARANTQAKAKVRSDVADSVQYASRQLEANRANQREMTARQNERWQTQFNRNVRKSKARPGGGNSRYTDK